MNKKKYLARKGQMELIGIIVIVIIVITALLLYMVYKINNPDTNIKRGFVNKELATNFLITITKANVKECPQHTIGDLVTDCANTLRRTIYCGGRISCEVANETLFAILRPAMDELGKNFSFSVAQTDISYVGCAGKEKVQATQVFTLFPSMQKTSLVLDICEYG